MFKIAIIGRPNVGKSSLFNRICRKRRSIVDELPGVTRDRIEAEIALHDRKALLTDTGGYFEGTEGSIEKNMRIQIDKAVKEADYILFIVDARSGIHPMDKTIFRLIERNQKPFITVANKVDDQKNEYNTFDLYSLGIDQLFLVSASHGRGIKGLLDHIHDIIPADGISGGLGEDIFKVCIVGKPNAGKSSLINAILNEERVIVTDVPGTTRDEIDIRYSYKKNDFLFIDTSGLRKKKHIETPADQFGISRTGSNIQKADCNLFIIDGSIPLSQQDKRIANLIIKSGKSCIVAVNKSDLFDKEKKLEIAEAIKNSFSFLSSAPLVFISAAKKRHIGELLRYLLAMKDLLSQKLETTALNKELQILQEKYLAPRKSGKRFKIYYGVQVSHIPLQILLFTNDAKKITESYITYLRNGLMKKFGLSGVPITFRYKSKKK